MGKTMVVVALVALVAMALPAHAAVSVTFSPNNPTAAQVNAGVTVSIRVSGIANASPPLPSTGASFYLLFDTAKLAVSNVTWATAIYANPATATSAADGIYFPAQKIGGTGDVSGTNTVLVSFQLKSVTGQDPSDLTVTFNTAPAFVDYNFIDDKNASHMTVDSWDTLSVSPAPPNPAHTTTFTIGPSPNRDFANPFNITANWAAGSFGDDIQVQYSTTPTGFPTTGLSVGSITDKVFTTTPATCKWVSLLGDGAKQLIYVRVRILQTQHGVEYAWNGTAAVDVSTNPGAAGAQDAGWTAAQSVTVDNQPPGLVSASSSDGSNDVFVTFNEAVTKASSEVVGSYTLLQTAGPGSPATITINTASNDSSSATVHLVTATPLALASTYTLAATSISDVLGNVSGALEAVTVLFKPKLASASMVQDSTKNHINAVFTSAMTASTVNTTTPGVVWTVTGGATNPSVTSAILQPGDGKTVLITVSAALAQNTTYTVTCPPGATDVATSTSVGSGDDSKTTFKTPYWHDFAGGVATTIGVPLQLTGTPRLTTLLGASKIASFDQTLNADAGGYNVDTPTEVDYANGKGYFARFAAATTSFFPLTTTTNTGTVNLPAVQDWNIVTNPFLSTPTSPVNINFLAVNGHALQYGWYWNGTAYELVANLTLPVGSPLHITTDAVLQPWRGYFVNAPVGTTSIAIGTSAAPDSAEVKPMQIGDKSSVLIQLVARAGNAVDDTNVCGVAAQAVKIANPPYAAGSVDLAFIDEDGNPQAFDVTTGSVARKFDLLVTTDQANAEVTVSAPDLSAVPKEYTVILSDPETGKKCALRTSAGFTFTAGATGASKHLVLEIVPRSSAALVTGVSVAQAGAGRIVVTYQLSGAAAVSASVMNIAGRVVRTLVASSTETAGTHTLAWDLANGAGAAVPRGTYLLRLQARTEDGQQVESVRTFAVNR